MRATPRPPVARPTAFAYIPPDLFGLELGRWLRTPKGSSAGRRLSRDTGHGLEPPAGVLARAGGTASPRAPRLHGMAPEEAGRNPGRCPPASHHVGQSPTSARFYRRGVSLVAHGGNAPPVTHPRASAWPALLGCWRTLLWPLTRELLGARVFGSRDGADKPVPTINLRLTFSKTSKLSSKVTAALRPLQLIRGFPAPHSKRQEVRGERTGCVDAGESRRAANPRFLLEGLNAALSACD